MEQHLFDVNPLEEESSGDSELTSSPRVTPTARQRRRHQREQQLQEEGLRHRERNRYSGLSENRGYVSNLTFCIVTMLVVDGTSTKSMSSVATLNCTAQTLFSSFHFGLEVSFIQMEVKKSANTLRIIHFV